MLECLQKEWICRTYNRRRRYLPSINHSTIDTLSVQYLIAGKIFEVWVVDSEIRSEISAVFNLLQQVNMTSIVFDIFTGAINDTKPYTASEDISGLGETTSIDSPVNTNSHNKDSLFSMDLKRVYRLTPCKCVTICGRWLAPNTPEQCAARTWSLMRAALTDALLTVLLCNTVTPLNRGTRNEMFVPCSPN